MKLSDFFKVVDSDIELGVEIVTAEPEEDEVYVTGIKDEILGKLSSYNILDLEPYDIYTVSINKKFDVYNGKKFVHYIYILAKEKAL